MAEQLRVINFNTYTHKSSIIKSNACASPDTPPQPYQNAVCSRFKAILRDANIKPRVRLPSSLKRPQGTSYPP